MCGEDVAINMLCTRPFPPSLLAPSVITIASTFLSIAIRLLWLPPLATILANIQQLIVTLAILKVNPDAAVLASQCPDFKANWIESRRACLLQLTRIKA